MIDFSTLQGLSIPEGVVTQIADAQGRVLWSLTSELPGTFYLRPSADIYLDSTITLEPEDATAGYLLINEEVGDYRSTHIALLASTNSGDCSGSAKFSVSGNIPEKVAKVTNFDLVVNAWKTTTTQLAEFQQSRLQVELTINGVAYSCYFEGSSSTTDGFGGAAPTDNRATQFYHGQQSVSKEELLVEINTYLSANGVLPNIELTFIMNAYKYILNDKDTYGSVNITQAYIELECE